jgi:hypothetical protein
MEGGTNHRDAEQLYGILLLPLLDSVVQNRNKRKAKQIVKTGIEFLLAVVALLAAVTSEERKQFLENQATYEYDGCQSDCHSYFHVCKVFCSNGYSYDYVLIEPMALALGVVAMIYIAALMAFVAYHAYHLPSESYTRIEIEEAYKKTNGRPIIGGVLEIPLAIEFGGAAVVFTLWIIFGLIFIALIYVLVTSYSFPYLFSSFLLIFTLYDLTAELCEYWVYTRPQNLKNELVQRVVEAKS